MPAIGPVIFLVALTIFNEASLYDLKPLIYEEQRVSARPTPASKILAPLATFGKRAYAIRSYQH